MFRLQESGLALLCKAISKCTQQTFLYVLTRNLAQIRMNKVKRYKYLGIEGKKCILSMLSFEMGHTRGHGQCIAFIIMQKVIK